MTCSICQSPSVFLFKKLVLGKHQVSYYHCPTCGFIQTETPYWLEEAYSKALSSMDVGIVRRNLLFAKGGCFLDYAGGTGMFTRLMRDKGFDFYHEDMYCENVFARYFGKEDAPAGQRFDLLTAFEVFEHLPDPMKEISGMFAFSDTVFFSTELSPEEPVHWWYLTPETGQHIAFYSTQTLKYVASKLGCHFYSNGRNLHLFSRKKMFDTEEAFRKVIQPPSGWKELYNKISSKLGISGVVQRKSLTQDDFDAIRQRLAKKN